MELNDAMYCFRKYQEFRTVFFHLPSEILMPLLKKVKENQCDKQAAWSLKRQPRRVLSVQFKKPPSPGITTYLSQPM